jgi:hypothetical protein
VRRIYGARTADAECVRAAAAAIGMASALTHPFAGHVERINKIWLQKGRKTNKRNELKPVRGPAVPE